MREWTCLAIKWGILNYTKFWTVVNFVRCRTPTFLVNFYPPILRPRVIQLMRCNCNTSNKIGEWPMPKKLIRCMVWITGQSDFCYSLETLATAVQRQQRHGKSYAFTLSSRGKQTWMHISVQTNVYCSHAHNLRVGRIIRSCLKCN